MNPIEVREPYPAEASVLWELMYELARFERYLDKFKATPETVRQQLFAGSTADFQAFVAVDGAEMVGMITCCRIPPQPGRHCTLRSFMSGGGRQRP